MKETDPIFAESRNILKKQFIEMNDLSTTEGNQYETKPKALIAYVINKKATCEVIFVSMLFQDK